MKKEKRIPKSKELLLHEIRQKEAAEAQRKEVDRRRNIAKDILFPLLLENSKNIRHAQNICKIVENSIMTLHNNGLATKNLSELELAEHFKKADDEASKTFLAILDAFKDEKLNSCLDIIGGMSGAIDSFIAQETSTRQLSELETHFL